MARRPSGTLANAVAPGIRVPKIEPLQKRIERNRRRFVAFLVAFTTGVAVSVAVTVGFGASILALLVIYRLDPDLWSTISGPHEFILTATLGSLIMSLVASWAWAIVRVTRSEVSLIRRLEAHMPKPGTHMATRSALRDMSIAAGLKKVPSFYVIDTPRVNAFVIARSPACVRIGVTQGMLDRITPDEQRAVFANLIARVVARDTLWATAVSALIGPIAAIREADLRRRDEQYLHEDALTTQIAAEGTKAKGGEVIIGGFLVYSVAVVATELLAWYAREAVWQMAEKADAEGMMLLKDPRSMVRAIEHVLDRDNHVPTAGEAYSPLFFCWAGFGFAPEDDPEMRRVARLRETLGAEGAAYVPRPNVPDWSNPPVAPRVELAEQLGERLASGE